MCEDFAESEDEDVSVDDFDTYLSDIPRRVRYYPAPPEPKLQTRLEEGYSTMDKQYYARFVLSEPKSDGN